MKPSPPDPITPDAPSEVTFRSLADDQLPPFESLQPPAYDAHVSRPRAMSVGTPSRPVLGLPLARWIPQDLHSVLDYANGMAVAGTAFATTDDQAARLAGITLASLVVGVSAVTDYRLSAVKLLPIEVHEVADYVWGATAIAAPFVLGYWKSSPRTAIAHIAVGLGAILGALVTDYRAYSKRSQTAAR